VQAQRCWGSRAAKMFAADEPPPLEVAPLMQYAFQIESLSRPALSFWYPAEPHHRGVHSGRRDHSRPLPVPRRRYTSARRGIMRVGFGVSRYPCDSPGMMPAKHQGPGAAVGSDVGRPSPTAVVAPDHPQRALQPCAPSTGILGGLPT
jgi:hypothetical protein